MSQETSSSRESLIPQEIIDSFQLRSNFFLDNVNKYHNGTYTLNSTHPDYRSLSLNENGKNLIEKVLQRVRDNDYDEIVKYWGYMYKGKDGDYQLMGIKDNEKFWSDFIRVGTEEWALTVSGKLYKLELQFQYDNIEHSKMHNKMGPDILCDSCHKVESGYHCLVCDIHTCSSCENNHNHYQSCPTSKFKSKLM